MAVPDWLKNLNDNGLIPYVAASESYLDCLDTSFFGGNEIVKTLEDPKARNFHEAYLVSNSLGFGHPEIKMPNWVYIDCVLMQTAVVGFAIAVKNAPPALVSLYSRDPYVDIDTLDYIPVSGQIAALGLNGTDLMGFSLFSLKEQLHPLKAFGLGTLTKYAALKAYKADKRERFVGLTQYDNTALKIHCLFSDQVFIDQPIMPLHPHREMSFLYSMKVIFDEDRILNRKMDNGLDADILLKVDDTAMKEKMVADIRDGSRFQILDPVHVKKDDGLYIPLKEHS